MKHARVVFSIVLGMGALIGFFAATSQQQPGRDANAASQRADVLTNTESESKTDSQQGKLLLARNQQEATALAAASQRRTGKKSNILVIWGGIPYHIIRPTIPVIAPTADPDGPMGVQGGLGDLSILDVYVKPFEEIKTNVGVGLIVIAPTSTHSQLGRGEWQLGPTVFAVSRAVPKWNLGFLVQAPFSMESNAYAVQMQPIAVRTLPNEWYVGSGDLEWVLDDQNGGYDFPISARVGKVHKFGDHILNIFLQPRYTPRGFHSG
jgi:hypothetical protein